MRKFWKLALLTTAAAGLLCVTALAADAPTASGIYNVTVDTGYTVTPQTAAGAEITGEVVSDLDNDGADETYYANAEKLTLTYSGATDGKYYLVMALSGTEQTPTEANLKYIDQTAAASDAVSFTVYPASLTTGHYTVYLSSNDEKLNTLTAVASFDYYAAYKLGDVNGDGNINITDASAVINHIIKRTLLTGVSLQAADTNKDGYVNITDVSKIINHIIKRELLT